MTEHKLSVNIETELKNTYSFKDFALYYQPQFNAAAKELRGAVGLYL